MQTRKRKTNRAFFLCVVRYESARRHRPGARSQQQVPALRIMHSNIEAFSKAMRKRLLEN